MGMYELSLSEQSQQHACCTWTGRIAHAPCVLYTMVEPIIPLTQLAEILLRQAEA